MSQINQQLFTKSSVRDITRLDSQQKCELIYAFWPSVHVSVQDYVSDDYIAFFDFIGKVIYDLQPHASEFVLQDINGLLAMVKSLRTGRTSERKAIIAEIKKDYLNTSDEEITRSIELTIRLWLGINVNSRRLSVGRKNPRDSRIDWHDNRALEHMVADQFKRGVGATEPTNLIIDESFTAVKLKNICRLHVRWTDNLTDHLKLDGPQGERCLSIYRHKILLINHRKESAPTIIPEDILDEAIRTLELLFPLGDSKTENFLEEEKVQLFIVNPMKHPRPTSLNEFQYWRNNLAQLLSIYNGPPETVVQTLLDTRNLGQFIALWAAIFGVFLSTVLFGILTTVYSAKQYRVAVNSYELALAVACQQKTAPLPGFCD